MNMIVALRAGLLAGAFATVTLLAGCGLSPEAQSVADACASIPRTTAESCQCYAKELQNKLKPELLRLATYAQTDPGKLFDPAVIGNVSANDVITVTQVSATALQTCKIV
jgi:hypothetical protein